MGEIERLTVSLSGGTDATEALGEALSKKQSEIDAISLELQQLKGNMTIKEEELKDISIKCSKATEESDELRTLCNTYERNIHELTSERDNQKQVNSDILCSKESE